MIRQIDSFLLLALNASPAERNQDFVFAEARIQEQRLIEETNLENRLRRVNNFRNSVNGFIRLYKDNNSSSDDPNILTDHIVDLLNTYDQLVADSDSKEELDTDIGFYRLCLMHYSIGSYHTKRIDYTNPRKSPLDSALKHMSEAFRYYKQIDEDKQPLGILDIMHRRVVQIRYCYQIFEEQHPDEDHNQEVIDLENRMHYDWCLKKMKFAGKIGDKQKAAVYFGVCTDLITDGKVKGDNMFNELQADYLTAIK